MSVLSREDLMKRLNEVLGDDADVTILEDVADTYDAAADHSDAAEWERKYKENEAAWRKRYRERFESGTPSGKDPTNQGAPDDQPEEVKIKSFDELFVEEK